MSDMRDKQAGWYESPNSSDEEWYWDGHAWKSRRAAGSTASTQSHPTGGGQNTSHRWNTQAPYRGAINNEVAAVYEVINWCVKRWQYRRKH